MVQYIDLFIFGFTEQVGVVQCYQNFTEAILIYFDNAATTKPCAACIQAVADNMRNNFGNPSSLHKLGIEAEKVLNRSKRSILDRLNAEGEIYFTSGATESNNTSIRGVCDCYKRSGNKIITTAIEHPSVARVFDKLEKDGFEVVRVAPKDTDIISAIEERVDEKTILISTMAVNNETGFIIDTKRLYNAVKRKNPHCIVHVDGVQAFCKVPITADMISLSAHKIHGPKGVGALYVAKGVRFSPLVYGGGQQKNLRSGTEAVDMIAGFAAAVENYPKESLAHDNFTRLNNRLRENLENIDIIEINSRDGVPNILNFSVIGVRSEIMLHFLEEKQIYVSSGSACSKGKKSEVLSAFGISDKAADSALRISFCNENTVEEVDIFTDALKEGIERFTKKYKK